MAILPRTGRRVALVGLLIQLTHRFRDASRSLPPGTWQRWGATLAIGLVLCLGLTWVATRIGEHLATSGALYWETDVILGLEDDRLLSFHDATWLQAFGSSAMMVPVVVFAIGMAAWMRQPVRAAGMLAVLLLAKVLIYSGWSMWERARPDFINDGIGVPAGLGAYPSGHVTQMVAVYGFLFYFWVRASRSWAERIAAWLVLLVLVVATGAARLRVGAHWPSDLVAGAVIGTALLAAMIVADRRAVRPAAA